MSASLIDIDALEKLGNRTVGDLRANFETHGYDSAFIGRAEAVAPNQLDQVRAPIVHWWLRREASPPSTLARLFSYSDPVSPAELKNALAENLIDELLRAGVLEAREQRILSRARIMPFEEIWIASDEMDAAGDPVMGPGATTQHLARAMKASVGSKVLDVGCGAGSLGLLAAARGAGEVVGVDLMERAIGWSRFNARLNGLAATFLVGDLTEPVKGRSFDLIVSQPPFVIQADAVESTTYLHGGRTGDEIAVRLLGEVPELLDDGGRVLVLFDSPALPERTVEQRVRRAVGGSGLQSLVLVSPGHSADTQAIAYSAVRNPALDREYSSSVHKYREHLEQLGIAESAHVLLVARRPRKGESPLTVVLENDRYSSWDAEMLDQLQRGAALASAADDSLMVSKVRLSPSAWLVQEQALSKGGGHRVRVRFENDRTPDFELSDAAAVLVEVALRAHTVRDIVNRYARAVSSKPAAVRAQVLQFVRGALVSGLLVAR